MKTIKKFNVFFEKGNGRIGEIAVIASTKEGAMMKYRQLKGYGCPKVLHIDDCGPLVKEIHQYEISAIQVQLDLSNGTRIVKAFKGTPQEAVSHYRGRQMMDLKGNVSRVVLVSVQKEVTLSAGGRF